MLNLYDGCAAWHLVRGIESVQFQGKKINACYPMFIVYYSFARFNSSQTVVMFLCIKHPVNLGQIKLFNCTVEGIVHP